MKIQIVLLLLFQSIIAYSQAPEDSFRVLSQIPHDTAAFTQGLEIDNGEWFESTGLYGQSTLRRLDPQSGEVLQRIALDAAFFGEGLTVLDDRIIQLTWRENTAFVWDRTTFELLFTYVYSTQGWGLTHDGARFIMSDGSSTLTFRDSETFETIGTVNVTDNGVPVTRLNELEWIGGEVWANIWQTDRIARINPQTGNVVRWINLAGLLPEDERLLDTNVLNGIAYDETTGQIFVTGKRWPWVYEIEIVPRTGIELWSGYDGD